MNSTNYQSNYGTHNHIPEATAEESEQRQEQDYMEYQEKLHKKYPPENYSIDRTPRS